MDPLQSRLAAALGGRYTVEREIGRGGMSIVYLGRDVRLERLVAIKVMRPEVSAAIGPARFLREIKVAAQLHHPYILKLHESGESWGLLYYVMPFVEGDTLRQRLVREGTIPVPDAVRIAQEVAEALDHAHRQNIVHRDIKPENILFEEGHAVVADFGIARAITLTGSGTRETGSKDIWGTIEYMSPEQESGRTNLDGRTDVYSLGIVLYEMLVGETPGPDRGLDSLTGRRPDVPVVVIRVLRRALARAPADRFASARQFADALSAATGARPRRLARARPWLVGGAVGAAAAVAIILTGMNGDGSAVDPQRYVILPFAHTRGAVPTMLDGDLCARLLYQGFAQWADINVTEPLRVSDALQRRAGGGETTPLDLDGSLAVARDLGAGRLVRGELWQFHDTTYVTAAIYDLTEGGREVATRAVRLVPGASEGVVFYALADSLLLADTRLPPGLPRGRATTSRRALLAHEEGHKALDTWDLAGAAAGFRRAVAYDSTFAHALLELAQVKAWLEQPPETWRDTATRAARMADRLVPRELLLARALEAMGSGRQDEACARYREALRRDSLDATAWYGLGECQAKDRVVLRDPNSPSGWRFRASYHSATNAYRRALDLAPSLNLLFRGQVYAHFARLLYTEPHHLRSGRPLPPDTGLFAAYPGFAHDTLAFVPYPAMPVLMGQVPPANPIEAMVRTRSVLGDIVSAWVDAFPGSVEAHAATAEWLEGQGQMGPPRRGERTALGELREARRLAGGAGAAGVDHAVNEVRVHLKLGDFGAARRLTDSLLDTATDPDAATALSLSGLAALTGRADRAAELMRRAAPVLDTVGLSGRPLGAPQPVLESAGRLLGYAAVGAPEDSVRATARRADSLVRAWLPPPRQQLTRALLLGPALELAFPVTGPSPLHVPGGPRPIIELQTLLARHDTVALRSRLAGVRSNISRMRMGEIAIDAVYQETLLFLALGDTALAREHLDGWLAGLPLSRRSLVWQVTQAGTFVRALALRADLAERGGDRTTARQWAQVVVTLWSDGDAGVQPLVHRMRRM